MCNSKRLQAFHLRSETKEGLLFLSLVFNIVLKDIHRIIEEGKINKSVQNDKDQEYLSLFRDDEILYLESSKEYMHAHTHLIRTNKSAKLQNSRSTYSK